MKNFVFVKAAQGNILYAGCEVRRRAVEVQLVKIANNISFAEAVRTVHGQRGRDEIDKGEQVLGSRVKKLILFIAYVINCTDQAKHKTEKKSKLLSKDLRSFWVLGVYHRMISTRDLK